MEEYVYKYCSFDTAIKIIVSKSVLLTSGDFNDPFDVDLDALKSFLENEDLSKEIYYLIYLDMLKINLLSRTDKRKIEICIENYVKSREEKDFNKLIEKIKLTFEKYKKEDYKNEIFKEEVYMNDAKSELIDSILNKAKSILITCFSKRNDSNLMWSHYADKHRGVCLKIKRKESFKDVEYSLEKKPLFNLNLFVKDLIFIKYLDSDEAKKKGDDHIFHPYFMKSKDWEYEEEVRYAQFDNLETKFRSTNKFLKVDITDIYVGCKADEENIKILELLAENEKIPLHYMKKSETKNELIIKDDIVKNNFKLKTQTKFGFLFEEFKYNLSEISNSDSSLFQFLICADIVESLSTNIYKEGSKRNKIKKLYENTAVYFNRGIKKVLHDNKYYPNILDVLIDSINHFRKEGNLKLNKKYKDIIVDEVVLAGGKYYINRIDEFFYSKEDSNDNMRHSKLFISVPVIINRVQEQLEYVNIMDNEFRKKEAVEIIKNDSIISKFSDNKVYQIIAESRKLND